MAAMRYRFGSFELHPDERRLTVGGKTVALRPHAFDLLLALVERSGHLVTKDVLLKRVWGKVVVEENTLQVHVSAVRKVLGADAIVTVTGRGYRFTPKVVQLATPTTAVADESRHNLPHPLTSFIGREKELDDLDEYLGRSRLVTLTGTGGCGKTRLAIEFARRQEASFADGAWLVQVAAVADGLLLPQAIATVLGVAERSDADMLDMLADHLASLSLMLVIDNVEHLIDPCARLIESLLQRCEKLVILVTSRERLRITGELAFRVPSLSVPDEHGDATPETIGMSESARLFVDRARLQVPEFAITAADCAPIASICRRLDGIALALELAAPCTRSMSVADLNARIEDRFDVLTEGSRTALPRHRTLRALIDWSYDLLPDDEKSMLRALSVFAGGWTLEAAKDVCGGEGVDATNTLDVLTSLADKNLVATPLQATSPRYTLLETIHRYAADRLREREEEVQMRRRHLDHFLKFAKEAEPQLILEAQSEWLDRLDAENDNFRAALSWAENSADDAERRLQLAGSLWRFWLYRGHRREGRALLAAQLATPANLARTGARAKALHAAGALARAQGDYPVARALCEEGLAIRRAQGDPQGIGSFLVAVGNVAVEQGDHASAGSYYKEALEIFREANDTDGVGTCLMNLGVTALHGGDAAGARGYYEQSLAIARQLGDRWSEAGTLMNLAECRRELAECASGLDLCDAAAAIYAALKDQRSTARAWHLSALILCDQGEHERARGLFEQCIAEFVRVGDETDLCDALAGLAYASGEHAPRRAATLWGAVKRSRTTRGVSTPHFETGRESRQIASARAALHDDREFALCWQRGYEMALHDAVRIAIGE